MQGLDATFDGIEFDRERTNAKLLPQFIFGAATLALIGSVAVYVMHGRPAATPEASTREGVRIQTSPAEQKAKPAINPFGEIIVEPGWGPKAASNAAPIPLPRLEPALLEGSAPISPPETVSPPVLNVAPPPSEVRIQPDNIPLPPVRDVARIEDNVPLPPPRPPLFGAPAEKPDARGSRVAEPSVPVATPSAGGPNLVQRLLGLARPPGSAVASASPGPAVQRVPPRTEAPTVAAAPSPSVPAAPQPQGRSGLSGVFAFLSPRPSFDRLGYDRYTAVYDISARTVYLPDGRKLEAHSGLGDRLDDPRFVSERMRGPTPPHLYELAMRESSFHGVQALRLNPVGEGGLYGRAGLLAHPYMLGPNGDSNGCVSVKDYEAFLRAYEDGEVKRLAVVARL
jgi:hypothetical protein